MTMHRTVGWLYPRGNQFSAESQACKEQKISTEGEEGKGRQNCQSRD